MISLSLHLIKRYGLSSDRQLITAIDRFKMYRLMTSYQKDLEEFRNQSPALTPLETYILNLETNPIRHIMYLLSQTHISNYFLDLYSLIFDPIKLKVLYLDRALLPYIADEIIRIWSLVLDRPYLLNLNDKHYRLDLSMFYNWDMISKFRESLNFEAPNEDQPELNDYWDNYFNPAVNKVRHYLNRCDLMKTELISRLGGLSQFPPEIYQYYIAYYLGLDIDETKLKEWETVARVQLKLQIKEINKIGKSIVKTDSNSNQELRGLLQSLDHHPKQIWNSSEQMMEAYQTTMNKYQSLWSQTYQFPVLQTPILKTQCQANQPRTYVNQGSFYLNLYQTDQAGKFEMLINVLREVVPGQYFHQSLLNNHPNDIIMKLYPMSWGLVQGWKAFAESLYIKDDPYYDRYGELQADLHRTVKLLIELDFHQSGRNLDQLKHKYSSYLPESYDFVQNLVAPGPHVAVKIAQIRLKQIFQGSNLYDSEHIRQYKDLLLAPEQPLMFVI